MFYLFIDNTNNYYYGNYSTNPKKSIQQHIRRANNSNSRDYNKPFYTALREHLKNFTIQITNYPPDFICHIHCYEPIQERSIQ